MQEILEKINQNITDYNNIDNELVFEDTQKLSSILKNLSSNLFYLESYRNHYHSEYNAIMHKAIKQNTPVSKSEIEAKEQVPELYMLRRLMTSAYKITDSIRTNISYLKSEKKC